MLSLTVVRIRYSSRVLLRKLTPTNSRLHPARGRWRNVGRQLSTRLDFRRPMRTHGPALLWRPKIAFRHRPAEHPLKVAEAHHALAKWGNKWGNKSMGESEAHILKGFQA